MNRHCLRRQIFFLKYKLLLGIRFLLPQLLQKRFVVLPERGNNDTRLELADKFRRRLDRNKRLAASRKYQYITLLEEFLNSGPGLFRAVPEDTEHYIVKHDSVCGFFSLRFFFE